MRGLDPAVFAAHEKCCGPFPEKGQLVKFLMRNGYLSAGKVELVWLAMDTIAIKIHTVDGDFNVFPGLGDQWAPLEGTFREQHQEATTPEQDERQAGTTSPKTTSGTRTRKARQHDDAGDAASDAPQETRQ